MLPLLFNCINELVDTHHFICIWHSKNDTWFYVSITKSSIHEEGKTPYQLYTPNALLLNMDIHDR